MPEVSDVSLSLHCIQLSRNGSKLRRQSWARLLQKVYEVDPFICPKCQGTMSVVAVIEDRAAWFMSSLATTHPYVENPLRQAFLKPAFDGNRIENNQEIYVRPWCC